MKSLFILILLATVSGCSVLPVYGEYKATPEEVLKRQDVELSNLKEYHKLEREYYLQLSIQTSTSNADTVATEELLSSEQALKDAKENAVIK